MNVLTKLSAISSKLGRLPFFLLSVLIFAAFIGFILPAEAERSSEQTGSSRSPDSSFIYSANDLYSMAEEYGEDGRQSYIKARFSFDLVWPLAYTFFLTAALSFFYRPFGKWQLFNLLPIFGTLFDFLENISASLVMFRFPGRTPVVAELAPIFTLVKWVSIYASFGIILIGIVLWVIYIFRKKVRFGGSSI
ncbi:hypothetical protein [Jeotgalibacillus proteolyticus]|uniref:Uncharacterized protein n=1 Tax=Jeotgalibacillus proteolyticus TaxID=2082395 RepID=A0A2S5G8P3_9BACL|nr:hypothetical protein [Jeotgalibacillus proteolyticus]PPA69281.1 hypothetical protein C4B60_15885 [Jeotgalibacillus proteolyticus]